MYQEVVIFLIGCFVLVKASEYAVGAIGHVAKALHLTEFVTSFLLVAFVAALPETFISLLSAVKGDPAIGLGTLLGGNIADLTIILGLVALAGQPLRIHSSIIKKDLYFAFLTILPIVLGMDGVLSRVDAVILILAGTSFVYVLLRERSHFHKPYQDTNHLVKQLVIFSVSVVFMILSAYYVVESSHIFAVNLGVPSLVVGLVLTALGTTLPEFTFSLQSVRKGHAELAIGDLLGVVVVDATIVTGLTALVAPIMINTFLFSIIGIFTAFAVVFALIFMRTDGMITKNEALALVFFYIAFIVVQLLVSAH